MSQGQIIQSREESVGETALNCFNVNAPFGATRHKRALLRVSIIKAAMIKEPVAVYSGHHVKGSIKSMDDVVRLLHVSVAMASAVQLDLAVHKFSLHEGGSGRRWQLQGRQHTHKGLQN